MADKYDKKAAGDRLAKVLSTLQINDNQWAKQLKKGDASYIGKMKRGEVGISNKYLQHLEKEHKVNGMWLLYGDGKPFGEKPPANIKNIGIPFYEGSIIKMENNNLELHEYELEGPDFFVQIPQYKDCDLGARASGDRMYPEIRNGDLLICKRVHDHDAVVFGDIYLLVLKGGMQSVNYLHPGESDEYFLLKARNESVPPTPMAKNKVAMIFKVRGVFKGY